MLVFVIVISFNISVSEEVSPATGEVEVDENFFGARHVNGKRLRERIL